MRRAKMLGIPVMLAASFALWSCGSGNPTYQPAAPAKVDKATVSAAIPTDQTASMLDSQAFLFDASAAPAFGLTEADGDVALSFGTFTGNDGTFELVQGTKTVSGNVAIGSCTFVPTDDPEGLFPAAGIVIDPCEVTVDGTTSGNSGEAQTFSDATIYFSQFTPKGGTTQYGDLGKATGPDALKAANAKVKVVVTVDPKTGKVTSQSVTVNGTKLTDTNFIVTGVESTLPDGTKTGASGSGQ